MRYLWLWSGVGLLACAAEAILHPIGAPTLEVLRVGMICLGVFIVLTVMVSIQIAVRSYRQSKPVYRRAKPVRPVYGGGYASDGGYVATADTGCVSDDGGGGGASC